MKSQTTSSNKLRGILFTMIGGICWGFSGACGQYLFLHSNITSGTLTVLRMIFAGLLLSIIGFCQNRANMTGIWKSKQSIISLVLFAILGLMLCQYTYLTAISHSNAGTATVLQYLGPAMIMLITCLIARKLPTRLELFCVFLAILGTFILATHGNIHSMVITPAALGWGLAAAVTLTFYTMYPVKLLRQWGQPPIIGYGMLIGGLILSVLIQPWKHPLTLDAQGVLALSAIILIGTVLAFSLYLQGVQDIGPVKASMLASCEPVSATIFSAVWLGSSFTPIDLLGFTCILVTVLLLAKKK